MADRLLELSLQRGRLQERIAQQRRELASSLQPLGAALGHAERGIAAAENGVAWLRAHPLAVGAAVAVFAALRPRRAWRFGRRAFVAWRLWQRARSRLGAIGLLANPPPTQPSRAA